MMYSFCYCCYFLHLLTGSHRAGDSESDCKSNDWSSILVWTQSIAKIDHEIISSYSPPPAGSVQVVTTESTCN